MQEQFEPLKNDLLLRAARGNSTSSSCGLFNTNKSQVRMWSDLLFGSCDKVSSIPSWEQLPFIITWSIS